MWSNKIVTKFAPYFRVTSRLAPFSRNLKTAYLEIAKVVNSRKMSFNPRKAHEFLAEDDYIVAEATEVSGELKYHWRHLINRDIIAKEIENAVHQFARFSEVSFFGSRVIGVAHERSDFDIYVKIEGKTYPRFVSRSDQSFDHFVKFKKLKRELESRHEWQVLYSVLGAAVPVIRVRYLPMNLDCDINISNELGTQNCMLLAHLFEIQPEAVKLFHFVRLWLEDQGFVHFKSYLITLLVLFYLQCQGLMPSGEEVHENVYPKVLIDGFEVQFDSFRDLTYYGLPAMQDYEKHVPKFFQFYEDFDYSYVISTIEGTAFHRSTYKQVFPKFVAKGIYIAGPCNPENNCGFVDIFYKNSFIALCHDSSNFFYRYF